MVSGSDGDHQEKIQAYKDNMESANESVEENVPKILSSELRDVFHVFASMLDVKSFMKLAITSKNMYKRCMENKEIKINVDEAEIEVESGNDPVYNWSFLDDSYIAALQKLPCKVTVRYVDIRGDIEASKMTAFHRHMKEVGVHRISDLHIENELTEWEPVIEIIKDIEVLELNIHRPVETDVLRSILQLNLKKLFYNCPVSVDFILNLDSPVQEIWLAGVTRIPKEKLTQILWKIQSGSLTRSTLSSEAIDWNDFVTLPFDHQGPLPADRPLLLERTCSHYENAIRECWYLHWHGGITKFVIRYRTLEIFKCEPCDYPWILRKEEDVLNDLAEKHERVSCSAIQFSMFSTSFTMFDPSHEWPLPEHRPLSYKVSGDHFLLLDEQDNLTRCTWGNGAAIFSPFSQFSKEKVGNQALRKHILLVHLSRNNLDRASFYCSWQDEFYSWFNELESVDFDYTGPLPTARPLVFKRTSYEISSSGRGSITSDREKRMIESQINNFRIVLLEDRLLECESKHRAVEVRKCHYLNRPPILFTAKNVVEMLQDPRSDTDVKIGLEVFREGFQLFRRSPSLLNLYHLIWEQATEDGGSFKEEYWYHINGLVEKVVWKEGRVFLKEENDLRESPPNFMKQVFRFFTGRDYQYSKHSFTMELGQFRSCLEQFTVVSFDYSGPLRRDSPLAFVKNEIQPRCSCTDCDILVWFLWSGIRAVSCSFGPGEVENVVFGNESIEKPYFLKSKEYLEKLLKEKYGKSSRYSWYGSPEEFHACLDEYMRVPIDYDGPLPEERPLVLEDTENERTPRFVMREDGTIIQCLQLAHGVSLSVFHSL